MHNPLLETFILVTENGSFSKAAEQLFSYRRDEADQHARKSFVCYAVRSDKPRLAPYKGW